MKISYFNKPYIVYAFIYLLCVFNWIFFFNYGDVKFYFEDWPIFHSIYQVWQISFDKNTIPFFANLFPLDSITHGSAYGSDKFFTKSWFIIQPQLFLLKFISIKNYIVINYIIFSSILFYSLLLWIRYLNLSILPSSFLLITILFNGKIMAQTGFGAPHMAFGYMLIPLFLWILKNFLLNQDSKIKLISQYSLFMCFILQNADMHIFYQMFLVSGLIILFYPKKYFDFLIVVFFSILGSLWYMMPIIFFAPDMSVQDTSHWRYFGTFGFGFQNGFAGQNLYNYSYEDSNLAIFLKFILNYFLHLYESAVAMHNTSMPNTQEYNSYVSIFGLIIIIFFILNFLLKIFSKKVHFSKIQTKTFLSCLLILIISAGPFHYFIIVSIKQIYNFNLIDAVPSRFYYYFFNILLIFISINYSEFIKNKNKFYKTIFIFLNISIMVLLIKHSFNWWVFNSFANGSSFSPEILNAEVIIKEDNYIYKYTVLTGYILALLFNLVLFYLSFIKKYNFASFKTGVNLPVDGRWTSR